MQSSRTFSSQASGTARPLPQWAGLASLLVLAVGASAFLILKNESFVAVGALLMAVLYAAILVQWQRGVYGLLLYLPVSGVVTLCLLPWNGPAAFNPVTFKDWLFVGPAYLGFAGAIVLRHQKIPRIGRTVTSLLFAFVILVVVEMTNPGVPNATTAFIGAKIWLAYLPLYALGLSLVSGRSHLTQFWRMMAATAVLPCLVGLGEYIASLLFGYERVMATIYGHNALEATQSLTSFVVGGGRIFRIPSTFTFETQYFGFVVAMLAPAFIVSRADPSARWRHFGRAMIVIVTLAGLLSGARGAFIFSPLLLVLMYGLDRGWMGVLRALAWGGAALAGAVAISSMAAHSLYTLISGLFQDYAMNTAYRGLADALSSSSWFGHGTGTNTGAARYALEHPEQFLAIENYYAKAAYELGPLGLLLVVALFVALVWTGLRTLSSLRDPGLRASAGALTAFQIVLALSSFKGWLMDLDPVNVYFWLFSGVLAGLSQLDSPPQSDDDSRPLPALSAEVQP